MRPVAGWFSELSPSPFAAPENPTVNRKNGAKMKMDEIIAIAEQEARRHGVTAPAGGIFHECLAGILRSAFSSQATVMAMSASAIHGSISTRQPAPRSTRPPSKHKKTRHQAGFESVRQPESSAQTPFRHETNETETSQEHSIGLGFRNRRNDRPAILAAKIPVGIRVVQRE